MELKETSWQFINSHQDRCVLTENDRVLLNEFKKLKIQPPTIQQPTSPTQQPTTNHTVTIQPNQPGPSSSKQPRSNNNR